MSRLQRAASALMLLSGVTHTAQFLLGEPSPTNTPVAAGFGVLYFAIGALLARPGPVGLWLGAIVGGFGGVLGGLSAAGSPDALSVFHAVISLLASLLCFVLLFQRKTRRIAVVTSAVAVSGAGLASLLLIAAMGADPFTVDYDENCSQCHGEDMTGLPLGPALVGRDLSHGDSVAEIERSIAVGFPATGMPGWSEILDEARIRRLAVLIAERRAGFAMTDMKVDAPLVVPDEVIRSEVHDFRIEVVASGLHPRPFSIAPLPDGRILLTEKTLGLSVISADGRQSELIQGTPPAHGGGLQMPYTHLVYGLGWMMDVAPHPDYEQNGWIYLHFGDRCSDCETSMNKLIRGRIEEGRWVDEETIWQAAPDTYTQASDMGAGGRISFDGQGHVFLSVGIKGWSNYEGVQDLGRPYGKIHRVKDDGGIPEDNPFVGVEGALKTTWSYGHRSPQGLEFDPTTGRLWSTEMGPRGGDELNLLLPGKNYGWPLTSLGVDYDGTPVEYGKELGIELDLASIEQPVVDMTPSPAVSSFILYRGSRFPKWQDNAIVGTLKATALYRWVFEGDRVVHQETLVEGIGRIRDVEAGPGGEIYLLLEHASGGQIVRLVAE